MTTIKTLGELEAESPEGFQNPAVSAEQDAAYEKAREMYREGRKAYEGSMNSFDCPYSGVNARNWREGYSDARSAAEAIEDEDVNHTPLEDEDHDES